jgi:hypothetical protein
LEADVKAREHSKSSVRTEVMTAERIRAFCAAVSAECPNTNSDCIAPPTFLTCFRQGELELFERIGLKLQNVLHGEQHYEYESDIHAGDEITFQTELSNVLDKKGSSGRLCFLTFETVVTSGDRKVGKAKTTIVVREKAAS